MWCPKMRLCGVAFSFSLVGGALSTLLLLGAAFSSASLVCGAVVPHFGFTAKVEQKN